MIGPARAISALMGRRQGAGGPDRRARRARLATHRIGIVAAVVVVLGVGAGPLSQAAWADLGTSSEFQSVSAGGYHNCAVRLNRSVACWGNNDYGQTSRPSGAFRSVSAGDFFTCGVRFNNTLACWGLNGYGQATPPA